MEYEGIFMKANDQNRNINVTQEALMKLAASQQHLPVYEEKFPQKQVGEIINLNVVEGKELHGTFRIDDSELQNKMEKLKGHQIVPIMGLNFNARIKDNEVVEITKVNNVAIIGTEVVSR